MARKQRKDGASPASSALFDKAVQHFRGNRLPEALGLFQQVLAQNPRHADSLHYLGTIALRIGHTDDAIRLSLQAIELSPDNASAHRTLADALALKGRLAEAEKHYTRTLELAPDATTYANLATVYAAGNDITRALHAILKGLKIEETPKLKSLFASCLPLATSIPAGEEFRTLLARALAEPWQRPGDLAKISVAILKEDPAFAGALKRATDFWPKRAGLSDLYGQGGLAAISRDPILRALLENTQFADMALERLLTLTRSALLDALTAGGESLPGNDDALAFFCALAQQCFTNEYVFACAPDEIERARGLEARLAATTNPDPLMIAAIACYRPLHEVDGCAALQDLPWPEPVEKLFTRQVREPAAERALRDTLPQLTPIADEISALVRQQYEENPYPRWVKTAPDETPNLFDPYLQRRVPHAPFRPLGKKDVDILIAGCGTGRQVIEMASSVLNCRVTAVDLSLSSLSYAKYRSDALGLNNVTYGQADILELGSLGRDFDMISCSGVLHHMGDPLHGWRTLLSLLRPNCVMEIALYSETARAEIVAARDFIAARGYGSTADDIRRARQEIMALDDSAPAKAVTESGDFYGTSTCRDLLFHVQEQRFTLPQIRAFLDEHGLEFLGFLLRPQVRRDYLKTFPQDRACTNLDNWQNFEQQQPALFRGMYQFLVQKRS